LSKLKDSHKSQDINADDAATNEMNQAWTAASEEIYKAQAGAQPQGEQPGDGAGHAQGSQPGGETVTDAEFEEVK
jgi:molecular chaperone DnaK